MGDLDYGAVDRCVPSELLRDLDDVPVDVVDLAPAALAPVLEDRAGRVWKHEAAEQAVEERPDDQAGSFHVLRAEPEDRHDRIPACDGGVKRFLAGAEHEPAHRGYRVGVDDGHAEDGARHERRRVRDELHPLGRLDVLDDLNAAASS